MLANHIKRIHEILSSFTLCAACLGYAQHPNVFIGSNRGPNEPAIAVDPKNPLRIVAGSNQDNVYTSQDGGRTWQENYLTSPFNVRGDPVTVVDTTGAFYFFHLSDSINGHGYFLDRIVAQRLDANASAWTTGVGIGYNPPKAGQDKPWATVDLRTNAIYLTWTRFDVYGSTSPTDSSNILFSKSTDRGETWTAPLRLNQVAGNAADQGFTVEGATPAVGPNGEIYVSWMGPQGLTFDRSLDNGQTWLSQDVVADSMSAGWDLTIPGLIRANGFPITAADASNGAYRGTVYICWSDQRSGPTDTDIWLRKSTDGGLTWSSRKRVNDDPPGRHQFFPSMSVDPATGYIWLAFYDRREHPASDSVTDVYLACSKDGGTTFVNFRISAAPFKTWPNWDAFLGDYMNISAVKGVVRPIWIRPDSVSGFIQRSVWTALVDTSKIGVNTTAISIASTGENPRAYIIKLPQLNLPQPFIDVLGRRHIPIPAINSLLPERLR